MKNKLISDIDYKFQTLYDNLEYCDYLEFINGNRFLKRYDRIIGRISIGYYPSFVMYLMSNSFLISVDEVLNEKINLI